MALVEILGLTSQKWVHKNGMLVFRWRRGIAGSRQALYAGPSCSAREWLDMLREEIKIKRIRVIKIDCFPRLMRQMRQIVVIGIDRQHGYTLRPECFA